MSHITAGEVVGRDLDALRTAATIMGCTMIKKKTYNWYGHRVGDTPLPKGMTEDQLGKCEYAIQVPGVSYEVGVVMQKDGSFTLAYDSWGKGKQKAGQDFYSKGDGTYHDGELLVAKLGDKLSKLYQQYNKAVVVKQARAKGYMVLEKTQANGAIKLQLVHA